MTWLGDQLSCVQNSFISPCREFKAYVGAYISLTFSKVLLAAQQLQRTSLRISYGKPKTGVLVGRPTIFTRSGQARQMRLIECWFHWWLNCQSLSRVRWHLYVSFYATWQQPCSDFVLLRQVVPQLSSLEEACHALDFFGCQSSGLPRFVHLEMVHLFPKSEACHN